MTAEDPGLAEAAQAIAATGAAVDSVVVDLTDYAGVERLYNRIRARGRPVDAIAINAGVGVSGDFTRETNLQDELALIQLKVTSAVHLAKRVVGDMVDQGHGRVLFTSSIVATMPAPFLAVYGASKAFIQSFSEALRNELKDTGVTVTALLPGATETDFFRRAGMEDTNVGAGEKDDPADVARTGFEALMAGKDRVIAGALKNKLKDIAAKILPETTLAQAHRRQAQPGTAGDRSSRT